MFYKLPAVILDCSEYKWQVITVYPTLPNSANLERPTSQFVYVRKGQIKRDFEKATLEVHLKINLTVWRLLQRPSPNLPIHPAQFGQSVPSLPRNAGVKTRTDPAAPMDIAAPGPLGASGVATEHRPRSISSTHSAKPRLRIVSSSASKSFTFVSVNSV